MNISDLLGAMMQSGMSPSSGDRMKKALGGGVMALLGTMAYQALKGSSQQTEVPLGLLEPQSAAERHRPGATFRDRAESHDQCRQGGRTD